MGAGVALESLYVSLEADISNFKKPLKEASRVASDELGTIRGHFGKFGKDVSEASGELLGFGATIGTVAGIAGLAFLTKNALETADSLGKLKDTTGLSTKTLQELGFAASQTNVDQSTLNQSLTIFNRTIGDAAVGTESAFQGFDKLKISLKDSSGHLKTNEQLLFEVSDKLSKIGSSAEQASVMQDLFGRSGVQLLPLLREGASGLKAFQKQAQELGLVLDDSLIASSKEANDKLQALKVVITSQVNKALLELAPSIQTVATTLIDCTKQFAANTAAVYEWYKYVKFSLTGVGDVKTQIDALDVEIGNLNDQIAATKGPVSTFSSVMQTMGLSSSMSAESLSQVKAMLEAKRDALEKEIATTTQATSKTLDKTSAEKSLTAAYKEREDLQKKAQKAVDDSGSEENHGAKIAKELAAIREAQAEKLRLHGDTANAIELREAALLEFYQGQSAKRIEQLMEEVQTMRGLKDSQYNDEIAAHRAEIDSLLTQENVGVDNFRKINLKRQAQDKEFNAARVQDVSSTLSTISSLSSAKNKELALIGKAAAIGVATIDGILAVQKALASAPPPYNFILAGLVGTVATANVARIAGVELATGIDEVPGLGTRDSFPALLQPGERVVPTQTNEDLKAFLALVKQGGFQGGSVKVELSLKDDLADFIEAKSLERRRTNQALSV
jgi:hypothetical protein